MKKIIVILLMLAMTLPTLAACKKKDNQKQESVGVDKLVEDYGFQWTDPTKPTMTLQTSGSTGVPKKMETDKSAMCRSAEMTLSTLRIPQQASALICLPMKYVAGMMMAVRCFVGRLRPVLVAPSSRPLQGLRCAPEFAALTPMQVFETLQHVRERRLLFGVRWLIIGGGAVDKKMSEALRDFPNNIWSSYAMTETLSHIALRRVNGPDANDWYTPFDTVDISQAADGCLVINAPLVHDGILKTNDIVEIRETAVKGKIQKQFRVVGRKDNVINSGGIKIQIEDVESALKPFLKAPFAITKAPEEKFGEEVVLVTEADDMSEIQEICVNALPRYWQPRRYLHVDSIPMTETGKPARQQIEQIARG